MWGYVVAAVGGVAAGVIAGVILEKILRSMKENRILKCSEVLEKNFGEPMFTNKFTFSEAKEWLMARQDKIAAGYKGIILKINKDAFEKIGSKLKIEKDLENYLLVGIYKDGVFTENLLVKYSSLDDELNNALKEEGTMVIE